MELHPVETEAQYERALEEISKLMEANPEPGTERRQTLSALVKLVDQYEREHHAIDAASPVELIRHHMEQRDLTQAELADRTGISEPRISEVLNEKRELSKSQIAALSDFFDVSPGLLFPDAPGESPAAQ